MFLNVRWSMKGVGVVDVAGAPRYAGWRLTADEYFELEDDGFRYELVDGVALLSPSRSLEHQSLAGELLYPIMRHIRDGKLGKLLCSLDVRFAENLVYCPDMVFFTGPRAATIRNRPTIPPDFIVEVVASATRAMDLRTKRDDYARYGVREYWAIGREEAWKFVLRDGKYVAEEITGDRLASEVIAGFVLDLRGARAGSVGGDESGEE